MQPLKETIIKSLTAPTSKQIADFADEIAHTFPVYPLGVLFYGSKSRTQEEGGLLDFYVIFAEESDFPGSVAIKRLGRVLPPNVYYITQSTSGGLHAKVAVLSLAQFLNRGGLNSLDSTIWARFCQPTHLVWSLNEESADRILDGIERCCLTASIWAAVVGPEKGTALEYWENLFKQTYRIELRVEKKNRPGLLLKGKEKYFTELLTNSWKQLGLISKTATGKSLSPYLRPEEQKKLTRRWNNIKAVGKSLNLARLLKASMTFKSGIRYISWKIIKHNDDNAPKLPNGVKHPIRQLGRLGIKTLKNKF